MARIKINRVDKTIEHRNKTYILTHVIDVEKSAKAYGDMGYKTIIAEIPLSKNLRRTTDLHGKPYKPSTFLYVNI